MASTNRGLVFVVDEPKRVDYVRERAQTQGEFTDTASSLDVAPRLRDIALISFDGESFEYAALALRGNKIATAKYVVRFSRLIPLGDLNPQELAAHIPTSRLNSVTKLLRSGGGLLTSSTWDFVWAAIRQLRRGHLEALDALERLASQRRPNLSRPGYDIVAEEKDAFLLAGEIFGIQRRRFDRMLTVPDRPAPFLRGLAEVRTLEDIMIQKDKTTFGQWIARPEDRIGSVELIRPNGQRLTVINANRTRVEETLGVDLIYYSHEYRAFAMVQYKTMQPEETEDRSVSVYRPIDKSYTREMARMAAYLRSRKIAAPRTPRAMRLSSNPFFLKLCPKVVLDPLSTAAIHGMYLPYDYWQLLVTAPDTRGPHGGIGITYENVGRYISNTLFVSLVQDGWVGSSISEERDLSSIINRALQGRRSVLYARESLVPRRGRT